MRKNNDGYVIIYVVFVILFLCIVAVGTCSSALSNLQNQNRAVEQMKERYTAQGEMEKQVADLCALVNRICEDDVIDPQSAAYKEIIEIFGEDNVAANACECMYSFISTDTPVVSAKVMFKYVVNVNPTYIEEIYEKDEYDNIVNDAEGNPKIEETIQHYRYTVSATSRYLSYTIENIGGAT